MSGGSFEIWYFTAAYDWEQAYVMYGTDPLSFLAELFLLESRAESGGADVSEGSNTQIGDGNSQVNL